MHRSALRAVTAASVVALLAVAWGMAVSAEEGSGTAPAVAPRWTLAADGPFAPPAAADEVVFVGGGDGVFRALDASTGAERWQVETGPVAAAPAVADGV